MCCIIAMHILEVALNSHVGNREPAIDKLFKNTRTLAVMPKLFNTLHHGPEKVRFKWGSVMTFTFPPYIFKEIMGLQCLPPNL